jgi:hypothetical protein
VIALALALALCPFPGPGPSWAGGWPPCPTEDANGCYWDAGHQGNGHGRSFVALPDGTVVYLDSPEIA